MLGALAAVAGPVAVVQGSMWCYARNIALTAREGVSAGRSYQASTGDGAARARQVLDRLAGDSLRDPGVSTAGITDEQMTITVTGTAPSLLPGLSGLTVSQSASGPRERWTTPGG